VRNQREAASLGVSPDDLVFSLGQAKQSNLAGVGEKVGKLAAKLET
jgi:hypothetical protein